MLGVFWAGVVHALMMAATYYLVGKTVQVDTLVRLLTSGARPEDYAVISRDALWIAGYFGGALGGAMSLAAMLRAVVSRLGLDRPSSRLAWLFRFRKAPWYYLLSGRDQAKTPDLIQIAALVNVGGQPYLYQGFLESYYFDEPGQLDRLVISQASRRPLSKDADLPGVSTPGSGDWRARLADFLLGQPTRKTKNRFYPIVGDYFVLHYDEIITLNVRYIELTDSPANGSESAIQAAPR